MGFFLLGVLVSKHNYGNCNLYFYLVHCKKLARYMGPTILKVSGRKIKVKSGNTNYVKKTVDSSCALQMCNEDNFLAQRIQSTRSLVCYSQLGLLMSK